jgi:hypothetical protein
MQRIPASTSVGAVDAETLADAEDEIDPLVIGEVATTTGRPRHDAIERAHAASDQRTWQG